jgi:hypothetical protein
MSSSFLLSIVTVGVLNGLFHFGFGKFFRPFKFLASHYRQPKITPEVSEIVPTMLSVNSIILIIVNIILANVFIPKFYKLLKKG